MWNVFSGIFFYVMIILVMYNWYSQKHWQLEMLFCGVLLSLGTREDLTV